MKVVQSIQVAVKLLKIDERPDSSVEQVNMWMALVFSASLNEWETPEKKEKQMMFIIQLALMKNANQLSIVLRVCALIVERCLYQIDLEAKGIFEQLTRFLCTEKCLVRCLDPGGFVKSRIGFVTHSFVSFELRRRRWRLSFD